VFQRVTIGSLPDNVLLEIFDFYQVVINKEITDDSEEAREYPWNWEKLVHVCRRWRYIIFESPIRLNLQLFCTEKSPVRKLLDVWPPFPLVIQFSHDYTYLGWESVESTSLHSGEQFWFMRVIRAIAFTFFGDAITELPFTSYFYCRARESPHAGSPEDVMALLPNFHLCPCSAICSVERVPV
jgi:F-box-like